MLKPTLVSTPFVPSFSDVQLGALKATLASSQLPPATYASCQPRYGITHAWMATALRYWENDFDWRKREEIIHSVDHFHTTIEDSGAPFKMHFVAHYSEDPKAIPLLFLHGWPGSFLEFIEVIKILKNSTSPSFHLICPSQPGFGFSDDPPLDRGFGMYDVARMMDTLMRGLGFENGYAVQGGDIGSVLARIMSVKYASCKAININYMPLLPPPSLLPTLHSYLPTALSSLLTTLATPLLGSPATAGLTSLEIANARKAFDFAATGRGYGVMHGTKPATIGIVVGSSPVALLAWLGEKFCDWTDEEPSLDVVLETVTMWWILGSFPKAIYAYSELTTGVGAWHRDPALFLTKPFGFSSFAHEIASAPRSWAAQTGNLAFYRYHERGGHFAALEGPAVFAEDMRDCFGEIYPC